MQRRERRGVVVPPVGGAAVALGVHVGAHARPRHAVGERAVCVAAADDWLNEHETDESAHKTRRWLDEPATQKQLAYLPAEHRLDFGLTRYRASALLTFRFNRRGIQDLVRAASEATPASIAEAA